MIKSHPLTISNWQLAKHWQLAVSNFSEWQMANGKCMVNGQWSMVNEATKGSV